MTTEVGPNTVEAARAQFVEPVRAAMLGSFGIVLVCALLIAGAAVLGKMLELDKTVTITMIICGAGLAVPSSAMLTKIVGRVLNQVSPAPPEK